jgi:alkylation response protein AidB-like acyl-CoA dehydrogenase
MNKTAAIDLVERARSLAPLIMREADEIERTRRLTQPVVTALIDNGLYRALLPKSLGGAEAPIAVFMQMLEEIAKADASTAWCLGQCSVCATVSAYMDVDAAREMFGKPDGILAWGSIGGEVQAVEGGYRATGRWEFASGVRQAKWIGAHVFILEADGSRRRAANGAPAVRTILFPLTSATLHDVWNVIGLKGTGTDSYTIENLFIPEKFAAARDEADARRETGQLYRIPSMYMYALGFAAVGLGVARAYLYATADDIWQYLTHSPAELSEEQRISMRLAGTWTSHQAAAVVDAAYHVSGSTAVFSANAFERRFRDMHAISQQLQARDTHYETAGAMLLSTKR